MTRIYRMNETMRMLGKNCIYTKVIPGGDYEKEFKDLRDAYFADGDVVWSQINFFALGYICGKRDDRKRKKSHAKFGNRA